MIGREHNNVVFECDECGEVLEGVTSDFNSAWARAKREGWRVRKIGNEWVHNCPRCQH